MTVVTMTKAAPLNETLDEAAYGGKAAQLSAAVRAGLPVPPGVAVPVDIVAAIAADDGAAQRELEQAIVNLTFPVAVRSSAIGEDSAGASFAGQHLTCLNVCTPAAVLEAVRAIFASGRSEPALAYRARLGIEREPRIGVVIQQLVMAERAGVLFSCNPVTGADELVIEAAWGLGEAVVAGLVTPDRYRLTTGGRLLERTIGVKDVAIRPRSGGGTQQTGVEDPLAHASCLNESDLARLCQLAARCNETFGGRQDLEWAFGGARLHLLQRRAVTRAPHPA
jgi:pyruvate,water dikinase